MEVAFIGGGSSGWGQRCWAISQGVQRLQDLRNDPWSDRLNKSAATRLLDDLIACSDRFLPQQTCWRRGREA